MDHCQATSKSYHFCCDRICRSAILNLARRWRSSKSHCFAEQPSSCPLLSPLFLPFVRFREEQNFRNPEMCTISYFVIKHRSANHSWRPSSKAARKKLTLNMRLNNNALGQHLNNSGIALLFNLILSVNAFDFILPLSLNMCFIIDLVLPKFQVTVYLNTQCPKQCPKYLNTQYP